MNDFDSCFERLIGHEGKYSNHPEDPGGETMYGITWRTARKHGYTGEMKDLPLAKAKEIARAEYWTGVRADELPEEIRFDVFDTSYNSGPVQAARLLQRGAGVPDDGVIGSVTLRAIREMNVYRLLCRFNGQRLDFLNDLKSWPSFSRGWTQRIAENLKGI